ncbi:MAG: antirestriction protein ArdA [Sneathiella sp.]
MTNTYHATPYDISAVGFYFTTYKEFVDSAEAHRNDYGDPVEEYEIQFIDGDNYKLFEELSIHQANLKQWFDDFEILEGDDQVKVIYLAGDLGCHMTEILDRLDDVILFEGNAEEYTESYLEDTGLLDQIPESLQYYIDVEAFARDLVLGGDVSTLEIDGKSYVVLAT